MMLQMFASVIRNNMKGGRLSELADKIENYEVHVHWGQILGWSAF